MIEFKQKVQLGNRISIPISVVNTLNIHVGDDVSVFCDEEQKMIYVKFTSNPSIFNRESGILTSTPYKKITDVKYKPITDSKIKPLTGEKSKPILKEN